MRPGRRSVLLSFIVLALCTGGERARAQECDDPEVQVYGINLDAWNPSGSPSAAELQALGARWARLEFKAYPDPYPQIDPYISELRSNGIRVMLLVDYSSYTHGGLGSPGVDGTDEEWDDYIQGFAAEMGNLAAHYGDGVDAWQIWNEPDFGACTPGVYDPCVPSHKYGQMLCSTYPAITAHSNRPIATAGFISGTPAFIQSAVSAAGGVLCADAVSVHPYGLRAPDDWPNPDWGFGNMAYQLDDFRQLGKPIWISEIGTDDLTNQAQYLINVFELIRGSYLSASPPVTRVFWFCWSDGMVPPFGLLDTSASRKDSYDAYVQSAPTWDPSCSVTPGTDADRDGYETPADCDDSNPDIHPGAAEICGNDVDEDCNGSDLECPDDDAGLVPGDAQTDRDAALSADGSGSSSNGDLSGSCDCRLGGTRSKGSTAGFCLVLMLLGLCLASRPIKSRSRR